MSVKAVSTNKIHASEKPTESFYLSRFVPFRGFFLKGMRKNGNKLLHQNRPLGSHTVTSSCFLHTRYHFIAHLSFIAVC